MLWSTTDVVSSMPPVVLRTVLMVLVLAACGDGRRPGGSRPGRSDASTGDSMTTPLDGGNRTDASPLDGSAPLDGSTPPDGGPFCPIQGPEDNTSACIDACDNDQNGFVDCNDFTCCPFRSD